MIRFAAPWLLAIGLPLVLLVAWRVRNLPRETSSRRRIAIQACMVIATLCAALALAGLEAGARVDRVAVVFALDRSRSVERAGQSGSTRALEQIRQAVAAMRPDDRAGLVVFGAEAATEVLPAPRPPIGATRAPVPRDATDIAAAIRRALADLPAEHAGRIVLVTDGVETQGDALAAASLAAGRGVSIDVLPIERAPAPEIAVERVRVPASADPDEPIEVRVVTRATRRARVRVTVMRDGEPLATTETTVAEGEDVLVMRDVAPGAGVHRYQAVLEPVDEGADVSRENNEGGGFMRVSGGSRALVLASEVDQAEALADAIRRGGMEVDVRGRTGTPSELSELAGYDLLVLDDVPARTFTENQLRSIASYVRDLGGGLLMVGTRDAFGLGGYAYSPVEEVLPATFDLRNRRDRASLGMIIAIDNSGSMSAPVDGTRTKLDLANEAAARSAELLSPFDRVGVIHVDTGTTWTQPMISVQDPAAIAARIRRGPQGGGGIDVDVACRDGYAALRSETTQLKHFLLFGDGADSQHMSIALPMTERSIRDGITTSVVSMGVGPYTGDLERMSRIGGGRFYIVENVTELPRIFTQETIEASRSAVVDEPFRPEPHAPSPVTRGIDFAAAPALGGYIVVNARPQASVLLSATDADPLLAVWRHGIGQSAVFTTDAGSNFGASWLAWPGYAALFGQLARELARNEEQSDARVNVTLEGGVGHVRVEAVDSEGRYRNYLELAGSVAAPNGEPVSLTLAQTGAGRYEATFPANAPGPYLVTVREGGRGMVGSAGFVRPSGGELRGEGTDREKLAQIAALTGGHVLTTIANVYRDRPPPAATFEPLFPLLLALAISLLLISVAMRRLAISWHSIEQRLPAWMRRKSRRAEARRDPVATLDVLTAAQRARREAAPEMRAALDAKPTGDDRPIGSTPAAKTGGEPAPTPAPKAEPAAPSSLAETLLARKKKK